MHWHSEIKRIFRTVENVEADISIPQMEVKPTTELTEFW